MNAPIKKLSGRQRALIAVWALLAGVTLVFGPGLRRAWLEHLLIEADGPAEAVVFELFDGSVKTDGVLRRFWDTGKIPHRLLVVGYLKSVARKNPEMYRKFEPLVVLATRDVDLSLRELAFGVLQNQRYPGLASLALEQLSNADPQIRILGCQYLKTGGNSRLIPRLIALLDDRDLRVAATAAGVLRSWTGNDFGARAYQATSSEDGSANEDQAQLRQALGRWKDWWATNQTQFGAPLATMLGIADGVASKTAAEDFVLRDLRGKKVRLSDFRGKKVLLNFWATWCTACLVEIPSLVELQKRYGDRLVILGICLDGGVASHEEEHEKDAHHDDEAARPKADLSVIRRQVEKTVKLRSINFTVLLDPTAEVGSRFNGAELPTNVLIDENGVVLRRFIGERPLAFFEEILGSASRSHAENRIGEKK